MIFQRCGYLNLIFIAKDIICIITYINEILESNDNPEEENIKLWGYTFCRLIIAIPVLFPLMNIIYLRMPVYRYIFCGLDIE